MRRAQHGALFAHQVPFILDDRLDNFRDHPVLSVPEITSDHGTREDKQQSICILLYEGLNDFPRERIIFSENSAGVR